jgi:hypothetical protein
MPWHDKSSPEKQSVDGSQVEGEDGARLEYRAPRIDNRLLTIVVQRRPDSRSTHLASSRKNLAKRRWI